MHVPRGELRVGDEPTRIPHTRLSPEALRGVISEFVTRDGTENTDLDLKYRQVLAQLERGEVVILYDPETQTTSIELSPQGPRQGR